MQLIPLVQVEVPEVEEEQIQASVKSTREAPEQQVKDMREERLPDLRVAQAVEVEEQVVPEEMRLPETVFPTQSLEFQHIMEEAEEEDLLAVEVLVQEDWAEEEMEHPEEQRLTVYQIPVVVEEEAIPEDPEDRV